MVKHGGAGWYRKYAAETPCLKGSSETRKTAKLGLWADPVPIPPSVYRKARRGQASDRVDLESSEVDVVPLR